MKLASKTAIVTGAARGIGFGIAQVLAREGARVIIADRDAHGEAAAASLRESGAQALFISCNIAEKTQVEALFSQAEEAFGPVDILVNNAGINRDAMLHKLTEADWDTVIDVNLKGTFLCMQQAAIRMRERGAGRIINIASASWLGNVGQTNYSASKAGVVGMTKTACRELAKKRCHSECHLPGLYRYRHDARRTGKRLANHDQQNPRGLRRRGERRRRVRGVSGVRWRALYQW
ncbi:3-oxoacyl-ACP reductase [Klebsiella pneumoniae]|nr:3-oxoacyl-ACP reductase [Klebsiella pneumoniae]